MQNLAMMKRRYRAQRGASILESFLAFFILLLIFWGVFQLFQLYLAHMVSDYAAFRGARSASVGFCESLVSREAHVMSVPVSGPMVATRSSRDFASPVEQFYYEQTEFSEYNAGKRWLEYSYWNGEHLYHTNYKCPSYGQSLYGECGMCGKCNDRPSLVIQPHYSRETVKVSLLYENYPLTLPFHELFSKSGKIQIRKEVELTNHSGVYLE